MEIKAVQVKELREMTGDEDLLSNSQNEQKDVEEDSDSEKKEEE